MIKVIECTSCYEGIPATHLDVNTGTEIFNVCCNCHEICQQEGWHTREKTMNKEMKELNETMDYLLLIGQISKEAKLYWDNLVTKIVKEGENNE